MSTVRDRTGESWIDSRNGVDDVQWDAEFLTESSCGFEQCRSPGAKIDRADHRTAYAGRVRAAIFRVRFRPHWTRGIVQDGRRYRTKQQLAKSRMAPGGQHNQGRLHLRSAFHDALRRRALNHVTTGSQTFESRGRKLFESFPGLRTNKGEMARENRRRVRSAYIHYMEERHGNPKLLGHCRHCGPDGAAAVRKVNGEQYAFRHSHSDLPAHQMQLTRWTAFRSPLGEMPALLLNAQVIRNREDTAHTMGAYVGQVFVAV